MFRMLLLPLQGWCVFNTEEMSDPWFAENILSKKSWYSRRERYVFMQKADADEYICTALDYFPGDTHAVLLVEARGVVDAGRLEMKTMLDGAVVFLCKEVRIV